MIVIAILLQGWDSLVWKFCRLSAHRPANQFAYFCSISLQTATKTYKQLLGMFASVWIRSSLFGRAQKANCSNVKMLWETGALTLKSWAWQRACGFNSRPRHQSYQRLSAIPLFNLQHTKWPNLSCSRKNLPQKSAANSCLQKFTANENIVISEI